MISQHINGSSTLLGWQPEEAALELLSPMKTFMIMARDYAASRDGHQYAADLHVCMDPALIMLHVRLRSQLYQVQLEQQSAGRT